MTHPLCSDAEYYQRLKDAEAASREAREQFRDKMKKQFIAEAAELTAKYRGILEPNMMQSLFHSVARGEEV